MAACADKEAMLQALVDGELDAANALAMEEHLSACPACAAERRAWTALHERLGAAEVAPAAPAALRLRIEEALAREAAVLPARQSGRRARRWRAWAIGGWSAAGMMAAAAATFFILFLQPPPSDLGDQLIADHVRSLIPGHLIDVATSDRHVVKPWFNGRIDFSPPVPELADRGFPLAGGRLDVAAGRVVPVLVYRRRLHVISLFILPAAAKAGEGRTSAASPPGYSIVHWRQGGLDYWAVSDVGKADLDQFRTEFTARASG
ncbi:MAG TPA: anti-sigma factor [Allosphingosinicella sp.]|nr:anti-sigma factor [Allosphingosinicella sp.]